MIRSDRELLAAHLAGDQGAFHELVGRLSAQLWRIARSQLTSPEDADEAVQDTLVRAHQAAARFRGDCSVTTWLTKILINVCLDRHRHDLRRPSIPLPAHAIDELADRYDCTAATDTRLDLVRALDTLPLEQRLPILLVGMHGFPLAEVSTILGVPVGTVKSRCARGRARLQHLLRVPAAVEEVAQ